MFSFIQSTYLEAVERFSTNVLSQHFPPSLSQPQEMSLYCLVTWFDLHACTFFKAQGHRDHLRDVPREDIFKLRASAAVAEFCE